MEYFKLILNNPDATVQLIAAVTASMVTLSSIIIKFIWKGKAKTKSGKKIKSIISAMALNTNQEVK